MPYLCVHTFNGREHVSVVYGKTLSDSKHREPILGEFEYIEITDAQASLTLEVLREWYHEDRVKAHEQRQAEEAQAAKVSDLLLRLADIIRQSHHDGERENAKALYLKFAGKAFDK